MQLTCLRDAKGICVIGEAKGWYVGPGKWSEGERQIRRYQRALGVPRAFLTRGWHWMVLGEGGALLDIVEEPMEAPKVSRLLDRLRPLIGKGAIQGQVPDETLWRYGLSP